MLFELQDGGDEILRIFQTINYTPFYHAVGNILENAIGLQFDTIGSFFMGAEWQPLAPSTIRDRKRHGFNASSILQRTAGDAGLKGSISHTVENDIVTIGTNKYYAPYLQFGTSKMPARPFIPIEGLPAEVHEEIQDALGDFFVGLFK